jgi:hypothetical protein
LRYNFAPAIEAARCSSLIAVCHGRGRREYAKIALLDSADYASDNPNARAPDTVRHQRAKFISGGQSKQLEHLQPIDLLHEESQRQIHLAGKGNSAKAAQGITALFDLNVKLRATVFRELGLIEREMRQKAVPPMDDDKELLMEKLTQSGYLRPDDRRTRVLDLHGTPMAPTAQNVQQHGVDGLEAFAKAVRAGNWATHTIQQRMPFTMEEWEKAEALKQKAEARKRVRATTVYIACFGTLHLD